MKIINKEIKTYKTIYQAIDGTEFDDVEECNKYESAANKVLRIKLDPCVIKQLSEQELYGVGSDEYELLIITPLNEEDVTNILTLMQYYIKGSEYRTNNYMKAKEEVVVGETYLFGIGCGYDNYDSFYYEGNCKEILENLRKTMGIDLDDDYID